MPYYTSPQHRAAAAQRRAASRVVTINSAGRGRTAARAVTPFTGRGYVLGGNTGRGYVLGGNTGGPGNSLDPSNDQGRRMRRMTTRLVEAIEGGLLPLSMPPTVPQPPTEIFRPRNDPEFRRASSVPVIPVPQSSPVAQAPQVRNQTRVFTLQQLVGGAGTSQNDATRVRGGVATLQQINQTTTTTVRTNGVATLQQINQTTTTLVRTDRSNNIITRVWDATGSDPSPPAHGDRSPTQPLDYKVSKMVISQQPGTQVAYHLTDMGNNPVEEGAPLSLATLDRAPDPQYREAVRYYNTSNNITFDQSTKEQYPWLLEEDRPFSLMWPRN